MGEVSVSRGKMPGRGLLCSDFNKHIPGTKLMPRDGLDAPALPLRVGTSTDEPAGSAGTCRPDCHE